MTDKERRKIKKTLQAYDAVLVIAKKKGIPVPPDVLAAVQFLRDQLKEG